ncbi:MAG TPA: DUF4179 domain-containing protein [Saprospiraceae bacterium]|nr:DUF4179 domain-containing protein [Saprospiraceae bacterium]
MKSKSGLEDFIRNHRNEFDDLKAPERVWEKLDNRSPRVHHLWKWSAVAACALLLISIGYIFGTKSNSNIDLAGWKEYQETEQYYEARIQSRMDKINMLAVSNEVTADLQVLDDIYQQLRTRLIDDPNADPQVLLNAMIRHQQQKLEIMEKILTHVDKYKKNEKDSREM